MKSSIKEKAPGSIVPSLSRYSEFSCRLLTARGSYSSVWQPRLCSHAQNVCYSSAWQLLLITDKRTHHVVYWFIRIILCPYLLLHHQILSILIFNFNFQVFLSFIFHPPLSLSSFFLKPFMIFLIDFWNRCWLIHLPSVLPPLNISCFLSQSDHPQTQLWFFHSPPWDSPLAPYSYRRKVRL